MPGFGTPPRAAGNARLIHARMRTRMHSCKRTNARTSEFTTSTSEHVCVCMHDHVATSIWTLATPNCGTECVIAPVPVLHGAMAQGQPVRICPCHTHTPHRRQRTHTYAGGRCRLCLRWFRLWCIHVGAAGWCGGCVRATLAAFVALPASPASTVQHVQHVSPRGARPGWPRLQAPPFTAVNEASLRTEDASSQGRLQPTSQGSEGAPRGATGSSAAVRRLIRGQCCNHRVIGMLVRVTRTTGGGGQCRKNAQPQSRHRH